MPYQRSARLLWLAPVLGLATLGTWLVDHTLVGPARTRILAKIAALSSEMGLRSAEVIAFPQARRRHPSLLLKLSQRADGKARRPKPATRQSRSKRL